ncbi:MAG: ribosome recycling factor [Candidatus Dadabacteria bacterium]|nr:MAG: ribosome recycling factor [Candidatus Dadabacteria bacterium]
MDNEELELALLDVEERMDRAVEVAAENLARIRTGRASADMLDHLRVEYYGAPTPLRQLATVTVPEPRTLMITPFDVESAAAIEKAIMQSDLGLTPNVSGEGKTRIIRINIPELSEERRKDLVRVARHEAEQARVAVRNLRREANDAIRKAEKEGVLGEDDARRKLDDVQKQTDAHVARIDKLLEQKEQDLLTV